MSFTITTDVFCDECSDWISGVSGVKIDKRGAWERAKASGWTKDKGLIFCPLCNGNAELRLADGTYVMKEPFKLEEK